MELDIIQTDYSVACAYSGEWGNCNMINTDIGGICQLATDVDFVIRQVLAGGYFSDRYDAERFMDEHFNPDMQDNTLCNFGIMIAALWQAIDTMYPPAKSR